MREILAAKGGTMGKKGCPVIFSHMLATYEKISTELRNAI